MYIRKNNKTDVVTEELIETITMYIEMGRSEEEILNIFYNKLVDASDNDSLSKEVLLEAWICLSYRVAKENLTNRLRRN